MTAAVDAWWRELRTTALLGTGRRPVPPLPVGGVPSRAAPEEALLDAAALAGALLTAGRPPLPLSIGEPAPTEDAPLAPVRAVQLLELVLDQPPAGSGHRDALLGHWLDRAAEHGRRVPPALAPAVLQHATRTAALRPAARVAVGRRGRWVAQRNAEWAWAAEPDRGGAATPPTAGGWVGMAAADRLDLLRALRRTDPAAARELVASTWATDGAVDRRAQLAELGTGLGPADEPLLERALDDRAAGVREQAADLLDGLPGSARAQRMAARIRPLVQRSGLLGRAVTIAPPPEPDAAAVRDAPGAPPRAAHDREGWWLRRWTAGAPLSLWTELVHPDPAVAVRRLEDGDVRIGLARAALLRRDTAWAAALVTQGWYPALLPVLAPAQREAVALGWLDRLGADAGWPAAVLPALDAPWSPRFCAAFLDAVLAAKAAPALLRASTPFLAAGLHPDALPRLEARLSAPRLDPALAPMLRALLQLTSVRRSISEAFA